ncbi:MAG: hypothetical protein ACE5KU_05720, partial [Nitrososphaerales archaeon]
LSHLSFKVVLMSEILEITLDIFTVVFALGVAFFALMVRNIFRGGLLWRPWRIIGPSPLLFAFAELNHITQEILGNLPILGYIHSIFETIFLIVLLYGFYLFYKVWRPTNTGKGEVEPG